MNSNYKFGAFLVAAAVSSILASHGATPAKPVAKPSTAVHKATTAAHPAVKHTTAHTAVRTTKPAIKAVRPGTKPAETLVWNSVTNGFALAKKTNKPILVDFYTDWCGWCKVMDEKTFKNANVKPILASKFVLVRANAEDGADGQKLSRTYQIDGYPTSMLFDANGKQRATMVGFVEADKFQSNLEQFLSGKLKAPGADSAGPSHPGH